MGIAYSKYKVSRAVKYDIKFQLERGSSLDVKKQKKMKRVEYICCGTILKYLSKLNNIDIICRNQIIKGSKLSYRPDLLFSVGKSSESKSLPKFTIYHIEIDEHGHEVYKKEEETIRINEIKEYLSSTGLYDEYILIRLNPHHYDLNKYKSKREMIREINRLLPRIGYKLEINEFIIEYNKFSL